MNKVLRQLQTHMKRLLLGIFIVIMSALFLYGLLNKSTFHAASKGGVACVSQPGVATIIVMYGLQQSPLSAQQKIRQVGGVVTESYPSSRAYSVDIPSSKFAMALEQLRHAPEFGSVQTVRNQRCTDPD